ncbi:MAG: hypothetical protein WA081_04025 [Desulfosalsimonadaceae bacterium]
MNKDIFFTITIKNTGGSEKRGMTVRIPPDKDHLPGDRIKALTEAARMLPLIGGERLRTEMLMAPPADTDIRPLADYLWSEGSLNASRLIRHLTDYKQGRIPHLFQPRVGITVVMEEEFIGREQPIATLENHIANGNSCHLRAPRRYGKSSLMGRLASTLPNAVMMELSDIGTITGFLKVLLCRCMKNITAGACLHKLTSCRSLPAVTDPATFSQVFNKAFAELIRQYDKALPSVLREIMTALADSSVILLIDEFSLFLRDMQEKEKNQLKTFLEIFHALRTRKKNPLIAVFAGSAGLSTYIELYGMHELFEDLRPVDVPPITAGEAKLLAEELFYGMGKLPSVAVVERLVALTGDDETIPYFVHALAHYTSEQAGRKQEVTEDDVERGYYDRLLGPPGNICFRDFILRERAYPGEYGSCASKVLKQLALRSPEVMPEQELSQLCSGGCDFRKLMTCLEEDYDLVRQADGWRMRSRVIAERWRMGEPWLTMGGV